MLTSDFATLGSIAQRAFWGRNGASERSFVPENERIIARTPPPSRR